MSLTKDVLMLPNNLDNIHTTELGTERVKKNLALDINDVVDWCRQRVDSANQIIRKGKNWYVYDENTVITINANSFTIITAHVRKP